MSKYLTAEDANIAKFFSFRNQLERLGALGEIDSAGV
jgi:hypothetical protein